MRWSEVKWRWGKLEVGFGGGGVKWRWGGVKWRWGKVEVG